MSRVRLAILISGRGSNMDSLLAACRATGFPAKPVLILSNRPDSLGLARAEEQGLPTVAIDHQPFGENREAFERKIDAALSDARVELIALAGFMRVLTPWFVGRWQNRMINIHPSLLPKYPGLYTHQRAIDAGDTQAGCSVHWVTEGVDAGAVIAQARVPVEANDTAERLAARVLAAEHELYPKALASACAAVKARR